MKLNTFKLRLDKALNENAISSTLKNLEQSRARKLQMFWLSRNASVDPK